MKNRKSLTEIALDLGRSQSTISREVARNRGQRGYRYRQANRFACERHETKNKAIKMTDEIKGIIDIYIRNDWSAGSGSNLCFGMKIKFEFRFAGLGFAGFVLILRMSDLSENTDLTHYQIIKPLQYETL